MIRKDSRSRKYFALLRKSPVELSEAELARLEAFELGIHFSRHRKELLRGLLDGIDFAEQQPPTPPPIAKEVFGEPALPKPSLDGLEIARLLYGGGRQAP